MNSLHQIWGAPSIMAGKFSSEFYSPKFFSRARVPYPSADQCGEVLRLRGCWQMDFKR